MNRTLSQLTRAARDLGVSTDGQLLAEFVARRDDGAFAQLARRHGPMVFAVCRRVLRHQHDAEDAFQATFLVLARKAEDVWPRDAVGAWLHGVAYRVAMKARGVRAKLASREHPLEDVARDAAEPPCPDLADVLDRAIRTLPEAYRAAVVACDLEGRTRKDAAEQLGWKEGTLSGRLARARQLLAARLTKAGLAGVALPATAEALPNELAKRAIAAGSNAGVSAPVAALTEGVVRGMFLTKIKTVSAALLAVCVMGLGVWSAAGQGPGEGGTGAQPAKRAVKSPAAKEPSDLEKLQGEWIIGWSFLKDNTPSEVIDAAVSTARKDGSLIVVKGAKMSWPLVEGTTSTTGTTGTTGEGETGTTSATTDSTTVTPRTFTIKLDPTQSPKHIDLTDEQGNVVKGIYKFIEQTGDFMFALNKRGGRPTQFEVERRKGEQSWNLWQPRRPAPKPPLDAGAAKLQGRWQVEHVWTDDDKANEAFARVRWVLEFDGDKLRVTSPDATFNSPMEFTFTAKSAKTPDELDLYASADGKLATRGLYGIIPATASEGPKLYVSLADPSAPRPSSIVRGRRAGSSPSN